MDAFIQLTFIVHLLHIKTLLDYVSCLVECLFCLPRGGISSPKVGNGYPSPRYYSTLTPACCSDQSMLLMILIVISVSIWKFWEINSNFPWKFFPWKTCSQLMLAMSPMCSLSWPLQKGKSTVLVEPARVCLFLLGMQGLFSWSTVYRLCRRNWRDTILREHKKI